MEGERHTIAEMAKYAGVSLRTLRFHEKIGLLDPVRVGAARVYAPRHRIKLDLLLTGRRLDFSLRQIADLIGTDRRMGADATITSLLSPAEVEARIALLKRGCATPTASSGNSGRRRPLRRARGRLERCR